MILKDLRIFSQNIHKSNFLINTILKVNHDFDIIFIQEPSWTTLRFIPSSMNPKGVPLLGVPNHPNWLTFVREPSSSNESPRVVIYINIKLSSFRFSFRKNIILASFFNNNSTFWIMNIYSDSSHTALKYLKDTEVNLSNLLIMTGDFNIRDSFWDPAFSHHSHLCDNLLIIADSFNLELLCPTNNVPTRYSDSDSGSNSTIDLMFLRSSSRELNSHSILPDSQLFSDHTPLIITIDIIEEYIDSFKFSIAKNSKEESRFIREVMCAIKSINADDLVNSFKLKETTSSLVSTIDHAWKANSK